MAISEMYDLLYSGNSVSEMQLDDYLNRVVDSIPIVQKNISINKKFDEMILTARTAIPLGIITLELVTNAVKYAFPGNTKGTVNISLKKKKKGALIEVKDNGKGLSEGFDVKKTDSMGMTLVHALVKQVYGSIKIEGKNGTRCVVEFPLE